MSQPLDILTFPLHQSRLIEASAGTGKTYTIAALYVRLVLQHGSEQLRFQRALLPHQILVVTFTEAATEELRERIRARLSEAAACFRQQRHDTDSFMQQLLADYPDQSQWPVLARQLDLAAQSMDDAAVHTIHGWCNRMLREHAFASGSLFSQQLQTDNKTLWLTATQDYWRSFYTAMPLPAYSLLVNEVKQPPVLLQKVNSLLSQHIDVKDNAVIEHWQRSAEQLQQLKQQYTGLLPSLLDDMTKQKGVTHHIGQLHKLQEWVTSVALIYPDFSDAAWDRISAEALSKKFKQSLHPDWQPLTELKTRIDGLGLQLLPLMNHAAGWIKQRFARLQAVRSEMGFDDMLSRLRDALLTAEGERLAAAIRQQFPVAMIDEFQDTDPVQYTIFNQVYQLEKADPDTGIFLIGDPKQAIYSFRNADIYTYLQARRATAGRHYTLEKNFRSVDSMVSAVNHIFTEAEQQFTRGAFLFKQHNQNELPFHTVNAAGLAESFIADGQQAAALQLGVVQSDSTSNPALMDELAAWYANKIALLLNDPHSGFRQQDGSIKRVMPEDIAILVNSASEAACIRKALRQRNVSSVYLSDRGSVFGSTLAKELLYILHACDNPKDPALLRTALACRLLQLDLAGLTGISQDELQWDACATQFADYQRYWQQHGVLAMLHRLLHDFNVPARLLATQDAQGERELTDILHLCELLQQQAAINEGNAGVIRYLAEHIARAEQDGNRTDSAEQQVRLESDSKLVQVITIHKSKGLQYPLVFLPFVANVKSAANRLTLPAKYHDADGQLKLVFSKEDSAALEAADDERLAEDIRKLYVALTRARFATFVGIAAFKEFKDTALCYLLSGQRQMPEDMLAVVQPHCLPATIVVEPLRADSNIVRYQPLTEHIADFQVCQMPAGFRQESWWVASYSALKFGAVEAEDTTTTKNLREILAEEQQTEPDYDTEERLATALPEPVHLLDKGPQLGNMLHSVLEYCAKTGFSHITQRPELLQQQIAVACNNPQWQPHQPVIEQWLQQFIQTRFPLNGQAFSLAELTTCQAEPEFWFNASAVSTRQLDQLLQQYILPGHARPALLPVTLNGMLKGFIDLIFEYQGQYFVLDYKSSWLGDDNPSYNTLNMQHKILQHRYDLQYVLYVLALHKLLRLRLGKDYCYQQYIGGAVYLFMRGYRSDSKGCFSDKPPYELIVQLDKMFSRNDRHD